MILVSETRALMAYRQILWTLVRRDLRVRYARSFLGYVWTILDPLAMALIYLVVFTVILGARRTGHQPYFMHLIVGMLAWQWFNQSLTGTTRALLSEARLVRSTSLPRELWVVRIVVAKGIEYVLSLPVIVVTAAFYATKGEITLNWTLVLFPFAAGLLFCMAIGLGLILAPVTVLVTDMVRVVRILVRMGFYSTPIIYSVESAPEAIRKWIVLNPLSGIMEMMRAGFFDGSMARSAALVSIVATPIILIVGIIVFKRLEPVMLKEI